MKTCTTIMCKNTLLVLISLFICLGSIETNAQCPAVINLSLNGGGSDITVYPGNTIDVTGDFEVANETSCPTCIRQLIIGFEADPLDCIYDDIPNVCPTTSTGTISGISFTAPSPPGTYNLYSNFSLEFFCNTASYAGTSGTVIGTVTVTTCPAEINLSLNGGGNNITVEVGTNIDVTGDFVVANDPSCPTCIRQLIIGLEDDAINCIYDGVPNVCPATSTETISGVSFTAPSTPGTYNLYSNSSLEFFCNTGSYAGTAGDLIGTITVVSCEAEVNLSLNGGGNTITVDPGTIIDVTGDLAVTNAASCPTCIRQLILGLEADAIDCIYDDIPTVCPTITTASISGVSFTAPSTPGTYNLYYNSSLEFFCNTASYAGNSGAFAGSVTVVSCPNQVNLSLNGGGSDITVDPGTTIDVTGNYEVANTVSCPTCITQLVIGLEADAIDCIYDGIPNACPATSTGDISGVSFTAPTAPGTYTLYSNATLEFACELSAYAGTAGEAVGTVTVVSCPATINLSLNGGGSDITVDPGATIDVTGNYEVANTVSCPTCITQLVIGLEADAIDCIYDGIPNACPATSTGDISGVSFTAPTAPGTYTLYSNATLEFACELSAYAGTAGEAVGTVTVVSCPATINLSLNGGGSDITVDPGATIDVTGDYEVANNAACPTCIRQLVIGLGDDAIDCIYDGVPNVCPTTTTGMVSGVSFTAPTAPGTYTLYSNATLEFACELSAYAGTAGEAVGTVTVASCPAVINLSLNGGGNTIEVLAGATIDVTGDYEVANSPGCPTCIRQLVIGLEADAIDCIYDGVPNVCPATTTGTVSGVSFTAPATPGVYNLYANATLEFACELSAYAGVAGDPVGVVTVGTTSIEENEILKEVLIYPNPVEDYLTINVTLAKVEDLSISLINSLGQVVLNEESTAVSGTFTQSIKTEQLSRGIYFLQLKSGEELISRKLILE